jgi:hypothetical protein
MVRIIVFGLTAGIGNPQCICELFAKELLLLWLFYSAFANWTNFQIFRLLWPERFETIWQQW